MEHTDALRLVERVKTRLVDLALAWNFVRDKQVRRVCESVWSGPGAEGGLVSELWVEGAFPPQRADESLRTLAASGLFDAGLMQHLDRLGLFPADRKLFRHQVEALRQAAEPRTERLALIVSAATGGGKTEAFLFPILN